VITYVGALPWLPAFRERAALALLFESVIPLLFIWAWFTIFVRDRPRGDRASDNQSSDIWGWITVYVGLPVMLAFGLTWAFSIVMGFELVISLISGSPVSGAAGP
jgi:hypothetical protein